MTKWWITSAEAAHVVCNNWTLFTFRDFKRKNKVTSVQDFDMCQWQIQTKTKSTERPHNRRSGDTWHRRRHHVPGPLNFIKFAEDDVEPENREAESQHQVVSTVVLTDGRTKENMTMGCKNKKKLNQKIYDEHFYFYFFTMNRRGDKLINSD